MAALVVFVAATCLYLGPVVAGLADSVGPDLGDPMLNLYFVEWGARVLDSGELARYWSPPFFHPARGVLTYSDHLFGPAVAVWIAAKLGIGPVAAFNLLILAAFSLTGWTTWWLLRRFEVSWVAAVAGGWIVAFGHYRWGEMSHYQILRAQWIPLVLWTFDRVLERPSWGRALPFLVVYALHLSGGTYLAYLVHFALLALLVVRWRAGGIGWHLASERTVLGLTGAAAVVVLFAAFSGYIQGWGESTAARRPGEVRQYGATLQSFATPAIGSTVAGWPWMARPATRGTLFLGFAPLALATCGAWHELRRRRPGARPFRSRVTGWAIAGAGSVLVAWGLWLADQHTVSGEDPGWLIAVGLPRYNGPRTIVLLGAVALWVGIRRATRGSSDGGPQRSLGERGILAAGFVGLVLALPVGFTMLNRWLPGMQGMRVSHRSFVFVALAVALLAARGLDALRVRLQSAPIRLALGLVVLLGIGVELSPKQFRWAAVPVRQQEFPGYARWIAASSEVTGYAVLPFFEDYRETLRMHHQTLHWRPMVNGYSANFPASYDAARQILSREPSDEELKRLRSAGVSHLVVHRAGAGRQSRRRRVALERSTRWIDAGSAAGRLELLYQDEEARVFRLPSEWPEAAVTAGDR